MKEQHYQVAGMSCSACSARVERCVSILPGVESVQVNLLTGKMSVKGGGVLPPASVIISAVEQAGYGASAAEQTALPLRKDAPLKRRFLRSLLFLIPLLILHHLWHGALSHGVQLLLLLPILWFNRHFFFSGLRSLLRRSPNMDTLVALGATAATVDGVVNLLLDREGMVYFESAGMILTLITFGKWLEARATGRTSAALEKLMELLPRTAVVLREGMECTLPADAIRSGDILLVRPGDRLPADGVVLEGLSSVDESPLTGESLPVEKGSGDLVRAGAINRHGLLRVEASGPPADSELAGIIQLVGEAASSKAPISRLADRLSGVFVPIVVALALLTFLIWLSAGETPSFAISCAIAVLVVSCPCALGLATPVAMMVGTGKGAENGILFRSGEALEQLSRIDSLLLDKTGTVTEGKPVVTDILPQGEFSREELLRLAASLETIGNHPLAEAVLAASDGISPLPIQEATYLPGRGVRALVEGEPCAGGNSALMREQGITPDEGILCRLAEEGKTPLCFSQGQRLAGIIAVQDPLKSTSAAAVRSLEGMGLHVGLISGDNERTVRAIAEKLGVSDIMADVLPGDKEAAVRSLQQQGKHVAMVGDGINDAPALTRADVGIALGAGTDIAMESADIVLVRNDPEDVARAIRLSRAVMRNIRQNLFWAFLYNTLAIPLAAGVFYPLFGWSLHPAVCAAAMGLSSFCVVTNALRLRRLTLHLPNTKMNTNAITIHVKGMMCPHCERHVTEALCALPEVSSCTADHKKGLVTLQTSAPVSPERLREVIRKAGYEVVS